VEIIMAAKPYLVMDAVEDRHWGETPQYKILLDWCRSENIEPEGCRRVEVYADHPQYALVTVYSLNEQNRRIVDEATESYVTHVVRVSLRTLPPVVPLDEQEQG
jgi:hypothetical protein